MNYNTFLFARRILDRLLKLLRKIVLTAHFWRTIVSFGIPLLFSNFLVLVVKYINPLSKGSDSQWEL